MTANGDLTADAVDALECGFVLVDEELVILRWNRWMSDCSGIDADHAVGRGLLDLFPQLAGTRLDWGIRDVVQTGMPVFLSHHLNKVLFPLKRRSGQTASPLVQAVVLKAVSQGDRRACLIQVNDITVSVNKEKLLRRAGEAKYKAIVGSIADAVVTLNEDLEIVIVNDSALALFGYDRSDLIGRSVHQIVPALTGEASGSGSENGYEDVVGVHRNGTELCLEVSRSVWDAYDRVFHTLVVRDVSARRRIEQQLVEAKEQAELANRLKSTFLTNMSREIRTPLNVIIGFSEILTDASSAGHSPGSLTETERDYLQDIRASGQKLLAIVNDVLDYARIEAGGYELCPEVVNVANEIDGTVASIRPRADSADLRVSVSNENRGAVLLADRRAVRRILSNILSNAVKFTPPGGTIEVRTNTLGREMAVTVTDTGVGIEPQNLRRVLLPFQQGGDAASRIHGGIGLGLPIAKALVEAHGGRLLLHSKPGIGTEVTLCFPLIDRERLGLTADMGHRAA